jgi:hypothetical protein
MNETTFTLGARQASALEVYVFDVAHEGDEERFVPGRLEGAKLIVPTAELERAYRGIVDAANACDDVAEGIAPGEPAEGRADRDALTALASRVLRAMRGGAA